MKRYFAVVALVFIALSTQSCSMIENLLDLGQPVHADVSATIANSASKALSPNTIFANLPATDAFWFTPSSFIVRVGTIMISDDAGATKVLYDQPDDSKCPAIDLAKGQKLSDFANVSANFAGTSIGEIDLALLPTVAYKYTDNNGNEVSGTKTFFVNTENTGGFSQYAEKRNRLAFLTLLASNAPNWGDSRIPLDQNSDRTVTLCFDLDYIIQGSSIINLCNLFPVTKGMYYDLYYFRKTGAGNAYPYKVRILYSTNGQPVYRQIIGQTFLCTGTYPKIAGLDDIWIGQMLNSGNDDRNTYIKMDGSKITLYPSNGAPPLGELDQADMSAVPYGSDFYDVKYFRRIITN